MQRAAGEMVLLWKRVRLIQGVRLPFVRKDVFSGKGHVYRSAVLFTGALFFHRVRSMERCVLNQSSLKLVTQIVWVHGNES